MPKTMMNIAVNGHSQVPPGFRFHPTEDELLQYYLKKKVLNEEIDLDVIGDVDLNKLEPWDIQEKCRIGTTPQNEWYFFSHKDRKYPTGSRTNRATASGFWKATGRDKVIYSNGRRIGMRKTLVFYKGRAPHGLKSDWIMHEYRLLDDNAIADTNNVGVVLDFWHSTEKFTLLICNQKNLTEKRYAYQIKRSSLWKCEFNQSVSLDIGDITQDEGWVVCKIFKKKNYRKSPTSPMSSSSTLVQDEINRITPMFDSSKEGALDSILQYMVRSYKEENEANNFNVNSFQWSDQKLMKLPYLESPNSSSSQQSCYQPMITANESSITNVNQVYRMDNSEGIITNWASLDRLVASQLHCSSQSETSTCFNDVVPTINYHHNHPQLPTLRSSTFSLSPSYNDIDLLNFASFNSRTRNS